MQMKCSWNKKSHSGPRQSKIQWQNQEKHLSPVLCLMYLIFNVFGQKLNDLFPNVPNFQINV